MLSCQLFRDENCSFDFDLVSGLVSNDGLFFRYSQLSLYSAVHAFMRVDSRPARPRQHAHETEDDAGSGNRRSTQLPKLQADPIRLSRFERGRVASLQLAS